MLNFLHEMKFLQIGELKKGINPASIMDLNFDSRYLSGVIKTGIVTGIIALAVRISLFNLIACINYSIVCLRDFTY